MDGLILTPLRDKAPTNAVVLIHGYGADCMNLVDIADYWRHALPETLFILPNGIEPCEGAPVGRQWFSLVDRTPSALIDLADKAVPKIMAYIQPELDKHKIPMSQVVMSGFSQGCMMAFAAGFNSPDFTPAGILGYSGCLLTDEKNPIVKDIPTCIVHGDADEVVPFDKFEKSKEILESQGLKPDCYVRPNLGHAIDEKGLEIGMTFIQKQVY